MTLEWKPPEDDGGCPIDHYDIEKMDTATGRWVPCGRTDATKAVVNNLQPGKIYQVILLFGKTFIPYYNIIQKKT